MADGNEGDAALSAWQRLAPWVLASASPRRAELLERAGLAFRVHPVAVDETPGRSETPLALCERLARTKAAAGSALFPEESILGGDTVVAIDDRVLGKPADRREAEAMLRQLSGRTHQVASSVALVASAVASVRNTNGSRDLPGVSGVAVSEVVFDTLDEHTLRTYLDGGEWNGKAGAYAIQGEAGAFAQLLSGDQDTVVGLPMALVLSLADQLLDLAESC